MKNSFGLALLSMALVGCATTSFKSTWKDPATTGLDITGKKIVTIFVSDSRATRLGVEEAVAKHLNSLGAQATASFQLLAPESTKEQAKQKLITEGFTGAVVMRVTDKSQEIYSTPGMYAPYSYGGYYGAGWGYGMAYGTAPEIRTNTMVYVETLVYSLKEDKLVWAGVTETTNPTSIDGAATEVATAAINKMKEMGLLK